MGGISSCVRCCVRLPGWWALIVKMPSDQGSQWSSAAESSKCALSSVKKIYFEVVVACSCYVD